MEVDSEIIDLKRKTWMELLTEAVQDYQGLDILLSPMPYWITLAV